MDKLATALIFVLIVLKVTLEVFQIFRKPKGEKRIIKNRKTTVIAAEIEKRIMVTSIVEITFFVVIAIGILMSILQYEMFFMEAVLGILVSTAVIVFFETREIFLRTEKYGIDYLCTLTTFFTLAVIFLAIASTFPIVFL